MTTLIAPSSVRQIALGNVVHRAAALLPQTATQNIFTVSGGIIVTSLTGRVTVVLGATVTTLTVGVTPSGGGSAQNAGLASATAITSLPVNTVVSLGATVGAALVVGAAAGTPQVITTPAGLYVPAGTITITTSASDTGSMKWDMTYVPFDDGATVVAA